MKQKDRFLIGSLFVTSCISVILVSSLAQAAKKKTVGELLKQASLSNRGSTVQMSKTDTSLPSGKVQFKTVNKVNLDAVKPPPSTEIFKSENQDLAEYERILDRQIREMFKMTQKFKNSPNRGELWLRLAELYVEKATLIDNRKQDEYDQKLRDFQSGKIKNRPILNSTEAREYNRKAIQLYEWFQRDFPNDEKMSQALFFLGYNHFEIGQVKTGIEFYERLTKEYPKSPFVGEAYFSLAEYYFENNKWKDAYKNYSYLIKDKRHRLHTFSLYKGAWCLFRLGKYSEALNYLEFIIVSSRNEMNQEESSGLRKVNKNRLENEALRDLVVFYAEARGPESAESYFKNLAGENVFSYMEKLAYQYSDRGSKENARFIFEWLIAQNPNAAKAFEYQYQIVQNFYYGKNTPQFKNELWKWISTYGRTGSWYEINKNDNELIKNSYKLRETTLRNFILQQHQTAQNSRAKLSQTSALQGYEIYLKEFPDSAFFSDMTFYYGELLYDLKKYDEASIKYKWVVDNAPQSKFANKAAQNLIIAAERSVPSDKELQKKVGESVDPIPLEPRTERFIEVTQWYLDKYPQSEKNVEIEFRVGRIYYFHNRFDEASDRFKKIVQKYPNSKYAEYSANLLLDIYNLKKDYVGLEKTGSELLAVPSISSSKAGADIRNVLEQASFKKAQDLENKKEFSASALEYETFARKNPKSELAITALFNAGINYERAGQNAAATKSYLLVLESKDPKAESFKFKAKRLLAKRYQDATRFEEAAKMFEELAADNPKDPLAANFIYNAAVLYEALGQNSKALKNYEAFLGVSKKYRDNLDVHYAMAEIHRKQNQNAQAIVRYKDYLQGGNDKNKIMAAHYWIYEGSLKLGRRTETEEWKEKTLRLQRRYANNQSGFGANFAAKIKLQDSLKTFNEMQSIQFPADVNLQKRAADKKLALLSQLNKELSDIIRLDSGEEIIASLNLLGRANQNMADTIKATPSPKGLSQEQLQKYKEGVQSFAAPFDKKAIEAFQATVDRAWELEVYTDYYQNALSVLQGQKIKGYYSGDEVASDVRLVNWIGL